MTLRERTTLHCKQSAPAKVAAELPYSMGFTQKATAIETLPTNRPPTPEVTPLQTFQLRRSHNPNVESASSSQGWILLTIPFPPDSRTLLVWAMKSNSTACTNAQLVS